MTKRTLVVGGALLVVALLAGTTTAQVLGTIQGRVVTDEGDAVPNVRVSVMNTETSAERVVYTDENGFFRARALASGTYVVTATLEGMQTVNAENQILQTGQTLDVSLAMGAEEVAEVITVTSESALVETSRSSAASYVSEQEVEALPILGRDFKEFAYLTPTVQNDTERGFVTMAGQRGIYTAMNVDGTNQKSGFFGYGRGGEATENDGLVVAQDSVKEFQVVTNGFAPEYGWSGGGYINVVTKSGSNTTKATGFFLFRDDSMAEDIPATPLDISRGNTAATPVDEFERTNFGLSVGGPIKRDRTHYFVSYDSTSRDEPFKENFNTRGGFDAVLTRANNGEPAFANLVDGYTPNNDGVAAPDPINGRTASGTFVRSVDNEILFGKIDFQVNASNTFTFRMNLTDYERTSSYKDEESLKTEETDSWVLQNVSVIGSDKINEARIQYAGDNLDRLSQRVGEPIEAQIRFRGSDGSGRDDVGKFDFLPIFVEEEKTQIQNNFSWLVGDHDLKFGVDWQKDDLSQLFAGSKDGRYDFQTLDDFINNVASNVRIYYGNVQNPNYDETQELLALYAQDSWRPNENLTINYGLRWGKTDNPDGLEHIFARGRSIPDSDVLAPRFGFAYALDETSVIRGGIGLFQGRTPSLLFASQVQQNGLFPNFGRLNIGPESVAFVPCCQPINNQNPPADSPNSPAWVDQAFDDAETLRFNFGWERQIGSDWATNVDLVYAEGENLQSNVELNRQLDRIDQFGRPVWSSVRPNADFNEMFVRESIGESEYTAVTVGVRKRYNTSGKVPYTFQAHYTWSEDKDTDSNERSATGVTVSNYVPMGLDLGSANINYDWGLSDRDVENRILVSGLVEFPYQIRLSGIAEYRSGRPWTAVDGDNEFAYCGFGQLGFNCTDPRAVINGNLEGRNTRRSESIQKIDLRLSKLFTPGNTTFDLFVEVFNLLDENSFAVGGFDQRDATGGTFGIADSIVTTPRQYQIGLRIRYNYPRRRRQHRRPTTSTDPGFGRGRFLCAPAARSRQSPVTGHQSAPPIHIHGPQHENRRRWSGVR